MFPLDDTIAAIASPPGGAARGIVRISGPRAIECVGRLVRRRTSRLRWRRRQVAGEHDRLAMTRPTTASVRFAGVVRISRGTSLAASLRRVLVVQASRLPDCDCRRDACTTSREATPASRWSRFTRSARRRCCKWCCGPLCAAGARLAGPGEFTLAGVPGRTNRPDPGRGRSGRDRRRRRPRRSTPRLANWPAGWPAPCTACATTCSTCWPTSKPASISPTRICPSSPARSWTAGLPRPRATWRPSSGKWTPAASRSMRCRPCSSAGRTPARAACSTRWPASRAALVSHQPGTTRDYLTAELDLDGVKCRLIDTAGTARRSRLTASHADETPIDAGRPARRRRAAPHGRRASAVPRFDPSAG